jgi:hypothetical protein
MISRRDFLHKLAKGDLKESPNTGQPDEAELYTKIMELGLDPATMTRDQMRKALAGDPSV